MNTKELLYYNEFGGFSKDGKEYIIKTREKYTPMPWSHIIANEKFGTLVTANGGGYTWSGNSRENKLTVWSNDPITDPPSEILEYECEENKVELLPYHKMGEHKYAALDKSVQTFSVPTKEDLKSLETFMN